MCVLNKNFFVVIQVKSVVHISGCGWSSGVFKAVKLLYSVSTSGPSATEKPISENMEEISSITWDTGCIFPFGLSRAGNVTSTLSFCSFWFSSIFF